jgi:hypothetical protein
MRVEIDIFSGRRNPQWSLSTEQSAAFLHLLRDLPKKPADGRRHDGLGYRGFRLSPDRESDDAGEIVVYHELVIVRCGARCETWMDEGRVLESWLLAASISHVPEPVLARVMNKSSYKRAIAMNRTHDPTMDLMMSAAAQFSTRIADIPGSLKGTKEGETEDNLLVLLAQIGERLVTHAHDVLHARGSAAELVARVSADQAITDDLIQLMPDLSVDDARGVAIRICVGCIEGAKVPRDEEMTLVAGKKVKRPVSDAERQGDMVEVDRRCSLDRVYAAGVSIGPLDKKLRNKQEPIFDGIDRGLLDKHFHEYFRRFPRSN